MYNWICEQGLTQEFYAGVYEFVQYACTLSKYENEGTIRCPYVKCKSSVALTPDVVTFYLYDKGFKPNYWW